MFGQWLDFQCRSEETSSIGRHQAKTNHLIGWPGSQGSSQDSSGKFQGLIPVPINHRRSCFKWLTSIKTK